MGCAGGGVLWRRRWRPSGEYGTLLFDTDIFIWIQRGHPRAASLLEKESERLLSVLTYMELLQAAQNRRQQGYVKGFIRDLGFRTLPLAENIGHRAAIYIEQYSLSIGLRAADAVIAATAAENGLVLCTSNLKHFRPILELRLHAFRP